MLSKVIHIIDKINESGAEAYIVGGAVRDRLLGKEVSDYDIVTNLTPEELSNLFGSNATTCGNSFLVSLIDGIEVATYRKDMAEEATAVLSLEEDVSRRDFTINALAYDIRTDKIIDKVNGVEDINNRVIRFVGDPYKRIEEDPARIIRAVRFAAVLGFNIAKEDYLAIMNSRSKVLFLPNERLALEIRKAFKSNAGYEFIKLLDELGMLEYIFPCLCDLKGIDGGMYHAEDVFTHSMLSLKAISDLPNVKWETKLAALLHDIGKCKPEMNEFGRNTFKMHHKKGAALVKLYLERMTMFPEAEYCSNMCDIHMSEVNDASKKSLRRFLVRLKDRGLTIKDFVWLRYADNKGNLLKTSLVDFKDYIKLYKKLRNVEKEDVTLPFSVKDLQVSGTDVKTLLDIPQCKLVGETLKNLFTEVVDGTIPNEREALLQAIVNIKNNNGGGFGI